MKPDALDIEAYHRKQAAFWNLVADGWKNESEFVESWLAPVSEAMSEYLGAGSGLLLDVGCGASTQPLPNGWNRIGFDLANEMLCPGSCVASVGAIPFSSDSFQAASSRFCLMFCPDMSVALSEISRVLLPNSPFVFAVWGKPEENMWSKLTNEIFAKRAGLRTPEPHEPGAFRLCDREEVTNLLKGAGFCNVKSQSVKLPMFQSLGSETALQFLLRLAGPMKMAYNKIPEHEKSEAFDEAIGALADHDLTGSAEVWSCKNRY